MRKNILFAVAAFVTITFLAASPTWAEGPHACGNMAEGEHQCLHGGQGELQCVHSASDVQGETIPSSTDMAKDLESYFAIFASLSQDSMENVQTNAKDLADKMSKRAGHCGGGMSGCPKGCPLSLLADAGAAAKSLSETSDIESARSDFGILSEKLAEYLKAAGAEKPEKLYVFTCDMAKKVWLQKDENPGNPYLGPNMANCKRKLD